ncbi:MAG: (deoxy)nucleoside triphosphate pyrophosphohydrolase [Alkalibacterium sp.]|nr:(deoxy)nucleoside triphosphate pyrophosphohydrolase [Alkalibacterium sp.]
MKNIYVVGAIIVEDGKVLCAQRGDKKALANLWEFPGGKIERNETPQEALMREIAEELLIEVEVQAGVFEETSYEYDFGRVHLTTFICLLKNGRPKLTEHHQVKWLEPVHLNSIEWAPADIPAVDKLMKEGVSS